MKIDIIMSKTSFNTSDGKTIRGVVLCNNGKVWNIDETLFESLNPGDTVMVISEKYKSDEGVKTRRSINKIQIG